MEGTPQAQFIERLACINCRGERLAEISRGKFIDQPLRGFLEADPWGTSPIPHLESAEWVLVQCRDCGQVFHQRTLDAGWNQTRFSEWMSAEAIQEFEARVGNRVPAQFQKGCDHVAHVLRIEKLTRSLRTAGEAVRLLDFGCGWGEFLALAQQFGFDAAGVDRSSARRDLGRVKIFAELDELRDTKPFHAITMFEVLEHLDDPAAVLATLTRLLARGGIVVLETPDCSGVSGIRTLEDYRKIHPLDHINAFTHETLVSIAGRFGLQCIGPGAAHVTADMRRVVRTEAKHFLGRDGRSTQLYFANR